MGTTAPPMLAARPLAQQEEVANGQETHPSTQRMMPLWDLLEDSG